MGERRDGVHLLEHIHIEIKSTYTVNFNDSHVVAINPEVEPR
jgi:hypothetical protein